MPMTTETQHTRNKNMTATQVSSTRKPRWDTLHWEMRKKSSFDPACVICSDLSLPYDEELYNWRRYISVPIKLKHQLSAFVAGASDGCTYCSLISRAVLHFVSAIWGEVKDTEITVTFDARLEGKQRPAYVIVEHPMRANMALDIFRDGDPPCMVAWCIGPGKAVPQQSDSDESYATIKSWLKTCQKEHVECGVQLRGILPKRVLDVSEDELRLCEGLTDPAEYLALSHCWGKGNLIITTRANLQSHKNNIDWAKLPLTFKDAVLVTRKLGFQYLWIDSLCIVQDDLADWETEAAQMASIYGNATLTLAATSATDGTVGFHRSCWSKASEATAYSEVTFADHDGQRKVIQSAIWSHRVEGEDEDGRPYSFTVRLPLGHSGFYPAIESNPIDFSRAVQDSFGLYDVPIIPGIGVVDQDARRINVPLLERAWVFQERLLSTRILHFAAHELVWECRNGLQCECEELNPSSCRDKRDQTMDPTARKAYSIFLKGGNGEERVLETFPYLQSCQEAWHMMLHHYTRLNLTRQQDRLTALSGIASRRSHVSKYHAGHWEDQLPLSLLWIPAYLTNKICRPDEYRAPSWSWAAVEGAIDFWPLRGTSGANTCTEIVSVQCTPAGSDPLGRVASGYIILRGPTVRARIGSIQNKYTCDVVTLEVGDLKYMMTLDIPIEVEKEENRIKEGQEVLCLLVAQREGRASDDGHEFHTWQLVLTRTKASQNQVGPTWRRLGLVWPVLGDYPWKHSIWESNWRLKEGKFQFQTEQDENREDYPDEEARIAKLEAENARWRLIEHTWMHKAVVQDVKIV